MLLMRFIRGTRKMNSEESTNESQVVICRFKAVSLSIAVGSGIPAKYSRVHSLVRYGYAKLSCRAGALTSPTLTIRFNPQPVRIATARTVRKGEKKRQGSRPGRRGETRGRGRHDGVGAASAESPGR